MLDMRKVNLLTLDELNGINGRLNAIDKRLKKVEHDVKLLKEHEDGIENKHDTESIWTKRITTFEAGSDGGEISELETHLEAKE